MYSKVLIQASVQGEKKTLKGFFRIKLIESVHGPDGCCLSVSLSFDQIIITREVFEKPKAVVIRCL